MGISTVRSGGAVGGVNGPEILELRLSGGSAVGVEVVVVDGRNWKSARRRSAHLLVAEKLLVTPPVVLAPPVTALSLQSFLAAGGGSGGDISGGAYSLKISIFFLF